jgi:hypothetical protein
MKYDVFYHNTGSPHTAGVEVQPPFETEADWRRLTDQVADRLKKPSLPKSLEGIGTLYCNGGSSQGTHFLAMPVSGGERFTDNGPARGVASYVGYLLRQDGHKVTVAHKPEWDGELMGSRDARRSFEEEVVSTQSEPQSGSEVAAAPAPEILPAIPETPES